MMFSNNQHLLGLSIPVKDSLLKVRGNIVTKSIFWGLILMCFLTIFTTPKLTNNPINFILSFIKYVTISISMNFFIICKNRLKMNELWLFKIFQFNAYFVYVIMNQLYINCTWIHTLQKRCLNNDSSLYTYKRIQFEYNSNTIRILTEYTVLN